MKLYNPIYFLVITFMLNSTGVEAQLQPHFTQYVSNESLINPAVTGLDGRTHISMAGRKDWLNFSAGNPTPQTFLLSYQQRILKQNLNVSGGRFNKTRRKLKKRQGRVGIGCSIISDMNGAIQRNGIKGNYAYHIPLNNAQFTMGFSVSFSQLAIHKEYLDFKDNVNEQMLHQPYPNMFAPDFNLGINYAGYKYHIGISVNDILGSKLQLYNKSLNEANPTIGLQRNYNLMGVYLFDINREWKCEPFLLLKMYHPEKISEEIIKTHTQIDLMGRIIYQHRIWGGLAYRSNNELAALVGMSFNNLHISYSYDYGFGSITYYSLGSHEISITASFGDSSRRYRWLERF